MSETKPPEGYETWIEAAIAFIDPTEMICTGRPDDPVVVGGDAKDMATAELAQLREQAAAYQNVMHELCRLPELNMSNYDSDQVAKLNTGVNNLVIAEIAAGRFVP